MQRGQRSPSRIRLQPAQRVWLLRALVLCVFGWVGGTVNVAFAATSVPMCSSYSECAEAPIPEAPPTGGEMRAPRKNLFDVGPSLDRAPDRDSHPLPLPLAQLEPLSLLPLTVAFAVTAYAVDPFGATAEAVRGRDALLEVFRPPC